MTYKISALSLILTILAALAGCHSAPVSSSAASAAATSRFVEFHDRSSWSFAKQQRWNEVQQDMNDQASSVIEQSQDGVTAYGQAAHFTSPAQLQDYLDGFERRRTSNPAAHSCRTVLDLKKPYDYSHCTQQQLTAEFFQQDEEQHGYGY